MVRKYCRQKCRLSAMYNRIDNSVNWVYFAYARKIVDKYYLFHFDRFLRENISYCVWAYVRDTTQVYDFLLIPQQWKKKYITKILNWTLSFEFNDSCFLFFVYFSFFFSPRCRLFNRKDFISVATSSQVFASISREIFFVISFLKFEWTCEGTNTLPYQLPPTESKSSTLFARWSISESINS